MRQEFIACERNLPEDYLWCPFELGCQMTLPEQTLGTFLS